MRQLQFLIACLCFSLVSCNGTKPQTTSSKPLILVSLSPYKTLVEQVAGEDFDVIAVVPISADPHSYEPTSRQLSQLSKGEIWFRIGESFESKLLPLLSAKPVDLRDSVTMMEDGGCQCHGHDTQDRHIWLSPKLMTSQATTIAKELSYLYPEQAIKFQKRLALLELELVALDRDIQAKIEGKADRSFLVSHPAFAYFCREYNCHQLSVEHEGKEPRPKEVDQLLFAAIEQQAKIAISLPQHNNKGAQLIAAKLHIPVRMIDPYAADYAQTMLTLASLIANPYQPLPSAK